MAKSKSLFEKEYKAESVEVTNQGFIKELSFEEAKNAVYII
jgi:hypothetical protein